jgi:hypothetical protein
MIDVDDKEKEASEELLGVMLHVDMLNPLKTFLGLANTGLYDWKYVLQLLNVNM